MNTSEYFSFPSQWTACDLARAVPLRLSQLFAFDAVRDGPLAGSANAASAAAVAPRAWRQAYLRNAPLPASFHIR